MWHVCATCVQPNWLASCCLCQRRGGSAPEGVRACAVRERWHRSGYAHLDWSARVAMHAVDEQAVVWMIAHRGAACRMRWRGPGVPLAKGRLHLTCTVGPYLLYCIPRIQWYWSYYWARDYSP